MVVEAEVAVGAAAAVGGRGGVAAVPVAGGGRRICSGSLLLLLLLASFLSLSCFVLAARFLQSFLLVLLRLILCIALILLCRRRPPFSFSFPSSVSSSPSSASALTWSSLSFAFNPYPSLLLQFAVSALRVLLRHSSIQGPVYKVTGFIFRLALPARTLKSLGPEASAAGHRAQAFPLYSSRPTTMDDFNSTPGAQRLDLRCRCEASVSWAPCDLQSNPKP